MKPGSIGTDEPLEPATGSASRNAPVTFESSRRTAEEPLFSG